MRYVGDIYRPPSEAYSYLLQVTIGCSHNQCTFCSMYKAKSFRKRDMKEIIEDLHMARERYSYIKRIFLCDGDALCLTNKELLEILDNINKLFPECQRVGVYASAKDILRKSKEELRGLAEAGLKILYIGVESGSDKILKKIQKDASISEIEEAVEKAEECNMTTSLTFLSGIGGKELWKENAVETGKFISRCKASYVSLLTLMLVEGTPLYEDSYTGDFELLSEEEVLEETLLLLENIDEQGKEKIFRSNHASNYVILKGELPKDKDMLINKLKCAIKDSRLRRKEYYRGL